jgi:hypothetical protein
VKLLEVVPGHVYEVTYMGTTARVTAKGKGANPEAPKPEEGAAPGAPKPPAPPAK